MPEPDEPVRAAILRALADDAAPDAASGWTAAALAEGVAGDEA